MNYPYGPVSAITLEMFRWKWHRICVNHGPSWPITATYWRERGAFISVLPRSSGKTKMLIKMIDKMSRSGKEDSVYVVTHSFDAAKLFKHKCPSLPSYRIDPQHYMRFDGLNVLNTHLVVDELFYLDDHNMRTLLSMQWKSVTMAGTYR